MQTSTFHPSQIGGPKITQHTYTSSPLLLLRQDIMSAFYYLPLAPSVLLPFSLSPSASHLSELYPYSITNLSSLFLHFILMLMQIPFLLSIPFWVLFPLGWVILAISAFGLVNAAICWLLNGSSMRFESEERFAPSRDEHAHEQWIYLNGVSIGKHWMMGNLNRLALTFGRPVVGVHNKTAGIIFDVIQCLIQRNFNYATQDIRDCYTIIKETLYREELSKVVFILHSQGGIEGGMIVDWLLQEVPTDLLAKLEVYTFGCAANHFNNPHQHLVSQHAALNSPSTISTTRITTQVQYHDTASTSETPIDKRIGSKSSRRSTTNGKTLRYIEHYAHSFDYVARWGVLYFIGNRSKDDPTLPRYMGRVFERDCGGHLLNQHYLDGMFPLVPSLDKNGGIGGSGFEGCADSSEFMDSSMNIGRDHDEAQVDREGLDISYLGAQGGEEEEAVKNLRSPSNPRLSNLALKSGFLNGQGFSNGLGYSNGQGFSNGIGMTGKKTEYKVRDLSRLWRYRNGGSPKPDDVDLELLKMASL